MPQFVNKLDELLADVVLSAGTARITARFAAKKYWDSLPDTQKVMQVQQITSLPELDMLNSLGVPKEIYNIFLAQIQKNQGASGVK